MTTLGNTNSARTPSGMRVTKTSYVQLEKDAATLRPALPVKDDAQSKYNLDVLRILEETLPKAGFNFHIAATAELKECAAFTVPSKKLIVLREDVYEGIFEDAVFSRSTVIHELAHIALDHETKLYRGVTIGEHQFCEDSEWQAKAMTVALMMPLEACRLARNATELAAMCGTSIQAASYRLERLYKSGGIKRQQSLWGSVS